MARAILITGATGKQGAAVIKSLLQADADLTLLALTRDASSTTSQRLAQKSPKIKIVQGDLDDPNSLFDKARQAAGGPIWGVYFVQNPLTNNQTPEDELKQAEKFIDTSLDQDVTHFVYGSVDRGGDKSFDTPTSIPFWASKHQVEHYLFDKAQSKKMGWTILRPVGFMDNYTPGFTAKLFLTCWKVACKDKPQQLIAVSDIGHFAAQAFLHPDKYNHRGLSLAGDELTFEQAAKVFKEKTGKNLPITFDLVALLALYFVKPIGAMFEWMSEEGFGANIEELKSQHPGLVEFGTYIQSSSGFVTNSK